MIEIILYGRRGDDGKVPEAIAAVPAIPRIGEYVDHSPSGIAGTVSDVTYWWGGRNVDVQIQIKVK